jgi:HEAT repeat protein
MSEDRLNSLIAALSSPLTREDAIKALAALHDSRANQAIINLLADHEDTARQSAAGALVSMGAAAAPALVDALQHANSTIRGAAAELLGQIQDESTREALRESAYTDKSQWVRSRARLALEQFPPGEYDGPRVRREPSINPPPDTIELVRAQKPAWPSLRRDEQTASPPDPDTMTAEQIRQILDQADIRLANGEITEETYKRLVKRWESRLSEIEDEGS